MMLDPRRLLILRAVSLRGGVTDAANFLNLTVSAISQQITRLEQEAGIPLLDRSQRPVGLTAAGRLLAARAGRIHAEMVEAHRELTNLSGRMSGPASVASFSSVVRHLCIPAIQLLSRAHPNLQPRLIELEGPAALKELRSGGVDLVVTENDGAGQERSHPGLSAKHLADDPYRIIAPAAWSPRPDSITDLASGPWIAGGPETPSGQALARLGTAHGFLPRRDHICTEYPTVLALVAAGLGAAIVPTLALSDDLAGQVALTGIPSPGFRRLRVLFRASDQGPEPMAAAWISALEAIVQTRNLRPAESR